MADSDQVKAALSALADGNGDSDDGDKSIRAADREGDSSAGRMGPTRRAVTLTTGRSLSERLGQPTI